MCIIDVCCGQPTVSSSEWLGGWVSGYAWRWGGEVTGIVSKSNWCWVLMRLQLDQVTLTRLQSLLGQNLKLAILGVFVFWFTFIYSGNCRQWGRLDRFPHSLIPLLEQYMWAQRLLIKKHNFLPIPFSYMCLTGMFFIVSKFHRGHRYVSWLNPSGAAKASDAEGSWRDGSMPSHGATLLRIRDLQIR